MMNAHLSRTHRPPGGAPRRGCASGSKMAAISFLLILTLPLVAFGSNEAVSADLSEFEGHWQIIEDEESNQARFSAIGEALEGLSWFMRKFASPILRKTTTPPIEIEFTWDGDSLHQGVESKNGDFSRPVNPGGEPHVGRDNRGEEFSSVWAYSEAGLKLRWEQDQAVGSNVYRINSSDDTLVVEHTIIVTAISDIQPIVFHSRFSRIDPIVENPASELRAGLRE